MNVTGRASTTISRGNVLWDNNTFFPHLGSGKFVKRNPFGHPYERMKYLDLERDYANKKVDRSSKEDTLEEKLKKA